MPTTFLKKLKNIQGAIPSMQCNIVPSSFEPDDASMLAFPLPLSWQWNSCEKFLRERPARIVLTRLPLFWQLEILLHDACKAVGVPLFIGSPQNTPLDGAAIVAMNIDTVVTSAEDTASFLTHLSNRTIALPKNWLIVYTPEQSWDIPSAFLSANVQVYGEMHLFPGIVILRQCTHAVASRKPHFHVSDGVRVDTRRSGSYLTIDKELPLSITDLELPFSLRTNGICACGRELVEKIS